MVYNLLLCHLLYPLTEWPAVVSSLLLWKSEINDNGRLEGQGCATVLALSSIGLVKFDVEESTAHIV